MTLQGDAMWLQMGSDKTEEMEKSQAEVTRLRLILDSARNFNVGKNHQLIPSLQLGVRHDGGDAEEGLGLEAGARLNYTAGAFSVEGSVRQLLAHEKSGYEEWGASMALRIDPGHSEGLSLNVANTWGAASSGVDRLWSENRVGNLLGSDNFEKRFDAEVGYGIKNPFSWLFGILTPYLGLSMGDDSNQSYRTGTHWTINPNTNLSLEMNHAENQGNKEDVLMLRVRGHLQ